MESKNRTFSQDVLDRRERKKYSCYGARDYQQSTLNLRSTNTTTPRTRMPPRGSKSMVALPRVSPPNTTQARKQPMRTAKSKQSQPKSPLKSMLPRRVPATEQRQQHVNNVSQCESVTTKKLSEQKVKLLQLLDEFKAALLEEDEVCLRCACATNTKTVVPKPAAPTKSQKPVRSTGTQKHASTRAAQDKCTQCGTLNAIKNTKVASVANAANTNITNNTSWSERYTVDHLIKFFQSKQQLNTAHRASISTINSASDQADSSDSDYKSGSPMSSSTTSINHQHDEQPKMYRSEMNINLTPTNGSNAHMGSVTSLSSEQPRTLEDWEVTFDFNDDAMMSEYEREAFHELIQNTELYSDVDSAAEEEIMQMGIFKEEEELVDVLKFDQMKNELAIISESLGHSANVIKRLSQKSDM